MYLKSYDLGEHLQKDWSSDGLRVGCGNQLQGLKGGDFYQKWNLTGRISQSISIRLTVPCCSVYCCSMYKWLAGIWQRDVWSCSEKHLHYTITRLHCFLTAIIILSADGALFPALFPFYNQYWLLWKGPLKNWWKEMLRSCFSISTRALTQHIRSGFACFDEAKQPRKRAVWRRRKLVWFGGRVFIAKITNTHRLCISEQSSPGK